LTCAAGGAVARSLPDVGPGPVRDRQNVVPSQGGSDEASSAACHSRAATMPHGHPPTLNPANADVRLVGAIRSIQPCLQAGTDAQKAFVSVNWVLTAEDLDLETDVVLTFLDYLLAGTSASVLHKALNDSGLGESVIGGGVDHTLRQPTYSIGLKGVDPDNVDKVLLPVFLLCWPVF
jgi:hypothetical protein